MRQTNHNSFYEADICAAKEAFERWQSKCHENIDEYILRRRRIELNSLVGKVIENELSDLDKTIVRLHWFKGRSINEVAAAVGIDRSNVSRRLDKINNIIYDKLKYAIEYRYGRDFSDNIRVIIKNKDAVYFTATTPDTAPQRIKQLRKRQCLSIQETAFMTGISEKRLSLIEGGETEITVRDVMRLAAAFKTDCDYIIYGKREGAKGNGFINQ